MASPIRVVSINGSYSIPSKTASLINLIVKEISKYREVEHHAVQVSQLGEGFTSALEREQVSAEVLAQLELVESADFIIAASSVYRASYTGLFKHFFDFIDTYALANKPVLIAATGGSDRHALVVEYAMRPLFSFLQSQVTPVGIYASSGSFDGTTILDPEVYNRIELAIKDIAPQLKNLTHKS